MQLQATISDERMIIESPRVVIVYDEEGTSAGYVVKWARKFFGEETVYLQKSLSDGYNKDFEYFCRVIHKYSGSLIIIHTPLVYFMHFVQWNNYIGSFPVFICKNNKIKNIGECVGEKELRPGHDIEKIYRNGGCDEW